MRWKIDAIIETRLDSAADETQVRKQVLAELWKLVETLEAALGNPMATSVHVLGVEPVPDEDG
jgi:hypothetical protein